MAYILVASVSASLTEPIQNEETSFVRFRYNFSRPDHRVLDLHIVIACWTLIGRSIATQGGDGTSKVTKASSQIPLIRSWGPVLISRTFDLLERWNLVTQAS